MTVSITGAITTIPCPRCLDSAERHQARRRKKSDETKESFYFSFASQFYLRLSLNIMLNISWLFFEGSRKKRFFLH